VRDLPRLARQVTHEQLTFEKSCESKNRLDILAFITEDVPIIENVPRESFVL
jgi:hypothetical protein